MRKTSYYNLEDSDLELEIFINSKDEITFMMEDSSFPALSISLSKEDVLDLIEDLKKLI
jgi:hypothetical protein